MHSGVWWCAICGFSHRRSVLPDMNALRNPLRNMHQPLAARLEKTKNQPIEELKLIIKDITDWCNQNSGFLTAIIFILTLVIGWISGFFKLIRKRPKFKIETIEGATFYSTIFLEKTYQGLPVHKTGYFGQTVPVISVETVPL